MKIKSFGLYSFRLELKDPLRIRGRSLKYRYGLLIILNNESGRSGYGEAIPLPGLHNETVEDCRTQLIKGANNLLNLPVSPDIVFYSRVIDKLAEKFGFSPSVRFALETALLNLSGAFESFDNDVQDSDQSCEISVNGLLTGSPNSIIETAQHLAATGYKSLKIKVGRADIEDEIVLINKLADLLPAEVSLRLDGNMSWTLEQALRFAGSIPHERIEYIEEPLQDCHTLSEFYRASHVPYALDESIQQVLSPRESIHEGLAALVLKPNLLGGFKVSGYYAALCRKYNLKTVLSDTFNSGISVAALANYHAKYIEQETPIGLDTYRYLKEDILTERLRIESGKMDVVSANAAAGSIKQEKLEMVYES